MAKGSAQAESGPLQKLPGFARDFLNLPFLRRQRFAWNYGRRYADMAMFKVIDGWLEDSEAIKLYDLAAGLDSPAPVVVELGSWVGKSSVVISLALRAKPQAKLYCIDPFNAAGEADSAPDYESRQQSYERPLLEVFQANVAAHGYPPVVETRPGYSFEIAPHWVQEIDLLFIDASHDYESVARDFREWGVHIKLGGYLAIHDVRLLKPSLDLSGPGRMVKEHVVASGGWEEMALTAKLFTARKVKPQIS